MRCFAWCQNKPIIPEFHPNFEDNNSNFHPALLSQHQTAGWAGQGCPGHNKLSALELIELSISIYPVLVPGLLTFRH